MITSKPPLISELLLSIKILFEIMLSSPLSMYTPLLFKLNKLLEISKVEDTTAPIDIISTELTLTIFPVKIEFFTLTSWDAINAPAQLNLPLLSFSQLELLFLKVTFSTMACLVTNPPAASDILVC